MIVKLNGGRVVTGVLRGFDPYMNIVMDDTVEERSHSQKINIGMVVRFVLLSNCFYVHTSLDSGTLHFGVSVLFFLNHRSKDIETLYMGADNPTLRSYIIKNYCWFLSYLYTYFVRLSANFLSNRFQATCLVTVPNPEQDLIVN